ncbi:MAG: hypothetical protein HC904_04165 [Blastochloris sp.]|nr:hypothetical protein [Blastochloris sp.]
MSKPLYSLDRETAHRLLTRHGLARNLDPSGSPVAAIPEEGAGLMPPPPPRPLGEKSEGEERSLWQEKNLELSKELEKSRQQVAEREEKVQVLEKANGHLEQQLDGLGKNLQEAGKEIQSLKEELAGRRVEIETLKRAAEQSQKEKGQGGKLEAELELWKERCQLEKKERETIAGKLIELDQELTATKVQLEEAKRTAAQAGDAELMARLRQQLQTGRDLVARAGQDHDKLLAERAGLKKKIEELELELFKSKEALKQAVMAVHQARSGAG